jgi:hypothetical protein
MSAGAGLDAVRREICFATAGYRTMCPRHSVRNQVAISTEMSWFIVVTVSRTSCTYNVFVMVMVHNQFSRMGFRQKKGCQMRNVLEISWRNRIKQEVSFRMYSSENRMRTPSKYRFHFRCQHDYSISLI